jgi:hypothetical protein
MGSRQETGIHSQRSPKKDLGVLDPTQVSFWEIEVGNNDLDSEYGGDGRRDRTRACWRSVQGAYQGCIFGTSVSCVSRRRRGTLLPFQEAESTGSA